MNRITKKYDDGSYGISECTCETEKKLGKLEDIEEEIGIDLITKDKVEKSHYVFVGYQNSIEINQVEIKKYGRLGIDIYDKNAVFKYNYLSYKDYGKTWSLVREELEYDK